MKLSKHSIQRMKERANVVCNQTRFFRNALLYGKSPSQITDINLKNKLKQKEKWNSKVKLYKNYIFIYSKNEKQLYTMYKMEEL